jgi:hypothetical protein
VREAQHIDNETSQTQVQPGQAVKLLNDRLKYISRVNVDVADWLQVRIPTSRLGHKRRAAANGVGRNGGALKNSTRRHCASSQANNFPMTLQIWGKATTPASSPCTHPLTPSSVFSTPWQKIVSSTQALADSHSTLSQNIGRDVEMPLRDFASSSREMQAMATITGNLQSIGKDVELAQKKADKLKDKGGKAATSKVASAASEVENAQGQWDSQAPYVFERLQAVDEERVDHLRNVLTQYQTHITDCTTSAGSQGEECMNAILNVQTADEIKTYAMRTTRGISAAAPSSAAKRRMSRADIPPPPPPPTTDAGSSLAPVPSLSRPDELSSQRSSSCRLRV